MKKLLIIFTLLLILISCGSNTDTNKLKNTINYKNEKVQAYIKKIDTEWQKLIIKYIKAQKRKDQKEMNSLKLVIRKHMKTIQNEMNNIKETDKELKSKEILRVISKLKLYTQIWF